MSDMVYCRECGHQVHRSARVCPACSTPLKNSQSPTTYKSKTTAALFAFFAGGFGIHRFYLGQKRGLFYLLFSCTLIPGLIAFIEFIVFLCTSDENWDRKHNDGHGMGEPAPVAIWVILAVCLPVVAVAVVGVLAAISLPAYQDYVFRAKMTAPYLYARSATAPVNEYFAANRTLPTSLQIAGFDKPLPQGARALEYDHNTGAITLVYNNNRSIVLSPTTDGQGKLYWECGSNNIRKSMLPTDCHN